MFSSATRNVVVVVLLTGSHQLPGATFLVGPPKVVRRPTETPDNALPWRRRRHDADCIAQAQQQETMLPPIGRFAACSDGHNDASPLPGLVAPRHAAWASQR